MARILLLQPPGRYRQTAFSLTLASISGSLVTAGHQVITRLPDLPWQHSDPTGPDLNEFDVAGISVTAINVQSSLDIVKRMKQEHPALPIIAGGAQATFAPESLLRRGVDVCIRGEGEYSVVEVVEALTDRHSHREKLAQTAGISYRGESGEIHHTASREPIQHLDNLPLPDWHQDDYIRILGRIDLPDWEKSGNRTSTRRVIPVLIESSRGCPYACVFCTTSKIKGKQWRGKSADRIWREYQHFKAFYRRYCPEPGNDVSFFIQFIDDNFTHDASRVETLCALLRRTPESERPGWSVLVHAARVRETNLVLRMRRAGCMRIYMGAECGYSDGLEKIDKGINLQHIEQATAAILAAGIPILVLSWIIGFPWESRRQAEETISTAIIFCARAPQRIKSAIYVFTPLPGTELTMQMGHSLTGPGSDHNRIDRWGFPHPLMNDTDLYELQMTVRWLQFHLLLADWLDSNATNAAAQIAGILPILNNLIHKLENRRIQTLFKELEQFYLTYGDRPRRVLLTAASHLVPRLIHHVQGIPVTPVQHSQT